MSILREYLYPHVLEANVEIMWTRCAHSLRVRICGSIFINNFREEAGENELCEQFRCRKVVHVDEGLWRGDTSVFLTTCSHYYGHDSIPGSDAVSVKSSLDQK